MKNKKKIVTILIVVSVIIILIAIGLFIFLGTDLFKSNKTLFLKYGMSLGGKNKSFIENDVTTYYEKLSQTPFENDTTFNVYYEGLEETEEKLMEDFNITSKGKIDIKNQIAEENASINYSEDITLPINLRFVDGLIGYQIEEYIGSKYIVDDTGSTIDLSEITSKVTPSEELSEEDIKNIFVKYGQIVLDQLPDEHFSKEESDNGNIYKLSITNTDINNIVNAVVEALKQDAETMEKLNLNNNTLNSISRNLQSGSSREQEEENILTIALYKTSGKINKIELTITDEYTILLEKTSKDENLEYKLMIYPNKEEGSIEISVSYNGLSTLQNIEENYTLKIDKGQGEIYQEFYLNNKINFIDTLYVESFNSENAVIYSEYDDEQLDSFIDTVDSRMEQVNKMQMEELGVDETQNPLTIISSVFIFGEASSTMNDELEEMNINSFNTKFEMYEGTNLQGTTVRGLLTTIASNNGIQDASAEQYSGVSSSSTNDQYLIEEINFNGEEYEVNQQNIAALKDEIVAENYYKVEFEKDPDTGAIYRVVINPK